MATLTIAPFAAYTGATVAVQVTQDEIIANLNLLKDLIGDPSVGADGVAPASPDFIQVAPGAAALIRAEIDAMIVVVDAMPIA